MKRSVISTLRHASSTATTRRSPRAGALLTAAAVVAATVAVATASPKVEAAPRKAAAPAPGKWTEISAGLGGVNESGTPTVWLSPSDVATVIWLREPTGSHFTYEEAVVSPSGTVSSGPLSIFGSSTWDSLTSQPTLVSAGAKPLLVMEGVKGTVGPLSTGCIVGATPGSPTWTVLTWSLSNNCANPIGGAAVTRTGELAAAWAGGWAGPPNNSFGVLYRVGVAPTIPAKGADSHIPFASGDAYKTSVAADSEPTANNDVYVAFAHENSNPSSGDGYYVKDVTAGSATKKAPDSGTNSISHIGGFDNLAITNSLVHPGIFMSYCSNGPTCNLELWRVGAPKAMAVPHSANAYSVAISAGPGGRVWLAWYDEANNTVATTRTNASDTAFGPVETFKTPCLEHGLVGISAGTYARLDVAMQCITPSVKIENYVTQSLAGLSLSPSKVTIKNTTSNKVTFKVTDVGAPVKGAVVSVDGHSAVTGAAGTATITFPKGTKTGAFGVTAKATNYFAAHAALAIKS